MQFWKIVLQDSNEVKMTKLQKLRKDNGISLTVLIECQSQIYQGLLQLSFIIRLHFVYKIPCLQDFIHEISGLSFHGLRVVGV